MICLHQTAILDGASTIDWNLLLSFINDRQLLIIDSSTKNTYLITIDNDKSLIQRKTFTNSDYPINACTTIHNNGQLILKMVKPTMLKFVQI